MNMSPLVQINESIVFGVIIAAWVFYRVIRNLTFGKVDLVREILLSLAFVYGCLVFKVTFFPMNIVLYAFDPDDANLVPLVKTLQMIQYGSVLGVVRNLVGNFVLLAPLGVFLPIFFQSVRRVGKMLGIGFLISLSIELAQLTLKVRIFDVDDLIFNTLGVLTGYLMFLLFNQVPILSRLFEKCSSPVRRGQRRTFIIYSLFTLVAFLSIYSYQIARQTQTETAIINALPSRQQTFLGTPKFGEFMFVVSQSVQGDKSYAIYRRVFFNRYTQFQWGDLNLGENHYSVSGMSTGQAINYFIIARSQGKAVAMTSDELKFPVAQVGEYDFSYARLPLNQPDRFFSFRFLDHQGMELGLSMEQ